MIGSVIFNTIQACDGHMDGQTDGQNCYISIALCTAVL